MGDCGVHRSHLGSDERYREARGLVQGCRFWTFSDIFSENSFPSVLFHGGFGLLNLYGIAKSAYRAFQLLQRLGTEILDVQRSHPTTDAWVIRKGNTATVLITNLAMPQHPIQTELLHVRLSGAPAHLRAWIIPGPTKRKILIWL